MATQGLNLAEAFSHAPSINNYRNALLICAVVWEYKDPSWINLEAFISEILVRIGMIPSATMLKNKEQKREFLLPAPISLLSRFQLAAEVLNKTVPIGKSGQIVLSKFQYQIWNLITHNQYVGISAPTSSGKSYVMINKILDLLDQEGGSCLIILPTIALINQTTIAFRKAMQEFQIGGIQLCQTIGGENESAHNNF